VCDTEKDRDPSIFPRLCRKNADEFQLLETHKKKKIEVFLHSKLGMETQVYFVEIKKKKLGMNRQQQCSLNSGLMYHT